MSTIQELIHCHKIHYTMVYSGSSTINVQFVLCVHVPHASVHCDHVAKQNNITIIIVRLIQKVKYEQ